MALLPAILVAAFAFYCGGFATAASFPGGPAGHLFVLGAAAIGAAEWRDPLRLGGSWRWLPGALVLFVAGSLLASPVPRAGRVGLALLPAFLLLPAFVARCLATERRREFGLAALAVATGAVAVAAFLDPSFEESGRAAMPLGHHNLLAGFLVILAPIAALGLRIVGPARWIALAALAATVAAVVSSRSFLNGAALAAVAMLAGLRHPRVRKLLLGLGLLALAALTPRATAIASGSDISGAARAVYREAALSGAVERPLTGWGPGSIPWLIAEFVRPVPGVNPSGEIVGEAHSLPAQLLFEIGVPGVALTLLLVGRFIRRRWRERQERAPAERVEAGLLGLAAASISGLGGAWIEVPALPIAIAIALGVALTGRQEAVPKAAGGWPGWIVLAGSALLLLPPAIAQAAYDRAATSGSRAAAEPHLREALRFDPDFPLYRARWAWGSAAPATERASEAVAAARQARGVSALWLRAGVVALEAGDRATAAGAFRDAMRLDPLSGFAPFQLAPLSDDPAACAGRALLADPRLAAAILFRDSDAARGAAIGRASRWPGIDAGWRMRFAELAAAIDLDGSDAVDLSLSMDGSPALALSLHLFRREPWKADLARIPVARSGIHALRGLPSAAELPTSGRDAFPRDRCAP